MSLSPWFKSPFTDLTGVMVSHQWFGPCQEVELKAIDCLEAYGLDRGREKCKLLLDDFTECSLRIKQFQRMTTIRWERNRQYWQGERSKENRWAKGPEVDSF